MYIYKALDYSEKKLNRYVKVRIIALNTLYIYKALDSSEKKLSINTKISYYCTKHFIYLQSFRLFQEISVDTKKNNDKSLCKEKLNQSIYINISYPKTRNLYDKKRQWQILYVKKIAIKSGDIFLYLKANLITLYENRKHE